MLPVLTRLTGPASEPLSLADAKSFCDITSSSRDADITAFIAAARDDIEEYTGLALIEQTWVLRLDAWLDRVITLDRSPLISVDGVKFYPADGGAQVTVSSGEYRAGVGCRPGFIQFLDTFGYPALADRFDAVEITFSAGHSSAAAIDPSIIHALKLTVREFFDRPETIITGTIVAEVPRLRQLLDSKRVGGIVA